jgi:hypothetical protein
MSRLLLIILLILPVSPGWAQAPTPEEWRAAVDRLTAKLKEAENKAKETQLGALKLAPKGAPLNPAFQNADGTDARLVRSLADAILTAAGYPVIIVQKYAPVCTNPFNLQLASDLVTAGSIAQVSKISGCVVTNIGTAAEWTKASVYFGNNNYTVEIRMSAPDGSPVTLYAPSPNGAGQPFYGWFSVRVWGK